MSDRDILQSAYATKLGTLAEIHELERQLAEARAQIAVMEWRPIETLSSDNLVWFWIPKVGAVHGYKEGSSFLVLNNGDYTEGGYGRDYVCGDEYGRYAAPTYWMPLPPPPKEDKT